MTSALDQARKQTEERESRNRQRDIEKLEALRAPTAALLKQYAEVAQEMRSRDGMTHANLATNGIRNGRTQLEILIGEEPPDEAAG